MGVILWDDDDNYGGGECLDIGDEYPENVECYPENIEWIPS